MPAKEPHDPADHRPLPVRRHPLSPPMPPRSGRRIAIAKAAAAPPPPPSPRSSASPTATGAGPAPHPQPTPPPPVSGATSARPAARQMAYRSAALPRRDALLRRHPDDPRDLRPHRPCPHRRAAALGPPCRWPAAAMTPYQAVAPYDWPALLALIQAAFAGMDGRIDPPSSMHRADRRGHRPAGAGRRGLGDRHPARRLRLPDPEAPGALPRQTGRRRRRTAARAWPARLIDHRRSPRPRARPARAGTSDPRRTGREPRDLPRPRLPPDRRHRPSRLRPADLAHLPPPGRGLIFGIETDRAAWRIARLPNALPSLQPQPECP